MKNIEEQNPNNTAESNYKGTLIFVVVSAALWGAMYLAYQQYLFGTHPQFIYMDFLGESASRVLNWLGINHNFVASVSNLENPSISEVFRSVIKIEDLGVRVKVTSDADAFAIIALVIACILAWPGNIIKKLTAIIIGVSLICVFNVLRIVGMVFVDIHYPMSFDIYKDWIFPLALALVAMLYFLVWIKISNTHPDAK